MREAIDGLLLRGEGDRASPTRHSSHMSHPISPICHRMRFFFGVKRTDARSALRAAPATTPGRVGACS